MTSEIENQERVTFFRTIDFLRELETVVLERVARLSRSRVWKPHKTLFYEGDRGDAMYCIISGEVEVYKTTDCGIDINVATLGEGAFFGHFSLLDQQERSASVKTICETHLLETRYSDFQQLLKDNPEAFWKILGGLSAMTAERE